MTRKQLGAVEPATIDLADRCAALLTLRLGHQVTRLGAVRIALGELGDKLEHDAAEAGEVAKAMAEAGGAHG